MSILSRSDYKTTVKTLDSIVDWSQFFKGSRSKYLTKKGRPDLRKKGSSYIINQIEAIRTKINIEGGPDAFKPMRESKKRMLAQKTTGTAPWVRGYISRGSIRFDKSSSVFIDFETQDGLITFESVVFKNEILDVETLKSEIKAAIDTVRHENYRTVAGNNNSANYNSFMLQTSEKAFIDKTAKDFEKYAMMAERGEMRIGRKFNRKTLQWENTSKGRASHPSEWMNGLLFR